MITEDQVVSLDLGDYADGAPVKSAGVVVPSYSPPLPETTIGLVEPGFVPPVLIDGLSPTAPIDADPARDVPLPQTGRGILAGAPPRDDGISTTGAPGGTVGAPLGGPSAPAAATPPATAPAPTPTAASYGASIVLTLAIVAAIWIAAIADDRKRGE